MKSRTNTQGHYVIELEFICRRGKAPITVFVWLYGLKKDRLLPLYAKRLPNFAFLPNKILKTVNIAFTSFLSILVLSNIP